MKLSHTKKWFWFKFLLNRYLVSYVPKSCLRGDVLGWSQLWDLISNVYSEGTSKKKSINTWRVDNQYVEIEFEYYKIQIYDNLERMK